VSCCIVTNSPAQLEAVTRVPAVVGMSTRKRGGSSASMSSPAKASCTAHGAHGSCVATSSCVGSGRQHYASKAGQVSGCEPYAENIQCCITTTAPANNPPMVPSSSVPESGTITECDVAELLRIQGVDAAWIPKLVCTAMYESGFNCGAENLANADGTGDYGLFQCNSAYWCSGGRGKNLGNGTGRTCQQLLACSEGARCAALVFKSSGINAWDAYKEHKSACDAYTLPASCSRAAPSAVQVTPPEPASAPTCNVGSRRGACLDSSDCTGNRESVPNHCPGAANIECCVEKNTPV
jgi:lysozyme